MDSVSNKPSKNSKNGRKRFGSDNCIKKKPWNKDEDGRLSELVKLTNTKNKVHQWTKIATQMVDRTGKQCRERWHNHLKSDLRKGDWTKEEDDYILKMQSKIGNQWSKITLSLKGRSDNSVKNRWYSLTRAARKRNVCSKQKNHESEDCTRTVELQPQTGNNSIKVSKQICKKTKIEVNNCLNDFSKPTLKHDKELKHDDSSPSKRMKRVHDPNIIDLPLSGELIDQKNDEKHQMIQVTKSSIDKSKILPTPLKTAELCDSDCSINFESQQVNNLSCYETLIKSQSKFPPTPELYACPEPSHQFNFSLDDVIIPPKTDVTSKTASSLNLKLSPLSYVINDVFSDSEDPTLSLSEWFKQAEAGPSLGVSANNKFEILSPAPVRFSV